MRKCLTPGVLAAMLVLTGILPNDGWVTAFSDQVITQGESGDDVIELQARLQYIGFFKGKIDGRFGYGTYWALRDFQQKYGLNVDGQAGDLTKQKLVKASNFDAAFVHQNLEAGNEFTYFGGVPLDQQVRKKTGTPNATKENRVSQGRYTMDNLPQGYSKADINLMANAVYGEARGEPYIGQVAVSAVILNRVADPRFPKNIPDVIFQPGAFTAVSDGQIWLTPNETAKRAVLDAINGWDPTHGALYYFNPETATSAWIWSRPQIEKIGKHIFCK
ncbi:spore cortex-lytic enzyme [Sporolactobacillus putidus]|uniref:Spore cortex-lytic enzyme n=2 Tax=Sporolactobacillus putidus TaxID=492735 RepID=A0A917S0R4_9BACL|nr:spore cortex-lytic enzyme [Sporolactobacillus putidus]